MRATSPYRIERSTRAGRIALVLAALCFLALLALPAWSDAGGMRLAVEVFYYLALAQAWNLLAGYTGLVSVGQQAYVGLGAYGFFALTMLASVPPLPALALAGIGAAAIALPTAFLVFRLRGAYFAIGTWVVAEVFRLLVALLKPLGGGTGMSLPVAVVRGIAEGRSVRDAIVYYLGLALGLGAVLLVLFWLRSRQGLALTAIRDSETAAASVGVDNRRAKLAVHVVAAGIAGLVGAIAFLEKLRISPDAAFSVGDWTANVIFIVVIGGIGSIEGPILGTMIFFALRALLADYGAWYLITLGAIAVLVMLLAPQGLWGVMARHLGLQLFPVHRRLVFTDQQSGPCEASSQP
ncbi:MAG TPA: branched-chain amino acid ABC transporter permease [Stellaceae bacterium]|nr:branched-chain amino acid ABC transporter permease [Stellaceae bacterium]